MSQGALSSVMLIASDGLLQNQGLAISGNLTIAINSYNSTEVVSSFTSVLNSAIGNVGPGNAQISSNTLAALQTLAANTLPAVTNTVPTAYYGSLGPFGNAYTGGLSGLVSSQAQTEIGDGDLSKFCQIYGIVQSYIVQTNQYINTVKNSSILEPTFSNMNSLTTASLSEINTDLTKFGADLVKLGQTWDLSNLSYFGFPWALLAQLIKVAGLLPELSSRLVANGVSQLAISTMVQSGAPVAANVDLLIYKTMTEVTGDLLEQVKLLLDVTTPNLTSMADLLNPVKALPTSYQTLIIEVPTGTELSPTATTPTPVYLPSGAVNSTIEVLFNNDQAYNSLKVIIPPDQALANQAIALGLKQIKNIFSLALPTFASAVTAMETNAGLNDINSLTKPVPTSVVTSLNSTLATGSGPNGTLTLFDFFGALAGVPYTEQFNQATATLNSMAVANSTGTLTDATTGVYTIMQNTLDGLYTTVIDPGPPADITITIPIGLPGAGIYTSLDTAFATGLLPAASNLIANIVSTYSANATSLNSNFDTIASQLVKEKNNLASAQVTYADLTANSRSSLLSLGTSLHEIGTDVSPGGQNEFFTAIADTSNIYGQAIVASLREGRNLEVLDNAGIGADTQIPSTSA